MVALAECIHNISMLHALPVSLLLAGLVGSATHCVGMCSPFVLAQVGDKVELRRPAKALLLPYHLGRMTTYVAFAVAVHSIINMAFLFSGAKALIAAPMLVMAAVLFLVSAFPALGRVFPWLDNLRVPEFMARIVTAASGMIKREGIISRYTLGVLLGFMPCGLVIAALMAAATAESAMQAAIAMAFFTIGTMPALILVAFGGGLIKERFPKTSKRFSQGALVLSSLWLLTLASTMIL